MVGNVKTEGTVCVTLSVRMVMKRKSHNAENETDAEKQGNFSIHYIHCSHYSIPSPPV